MRTELVATVNGRDLALSIESTDGRWTLSLDGRAIEVDAVRLGNGLWSILADGRSLVVDLAPVGRDPDTPRDAVAGGHALSIQLESARARELRALGNRGGAARRGEKLRAPIAGKVVKLHVEVGSEVAAGDPIVVLEAMKMENELRASRGGTVKSIKVSPGDSVETSQLLVIIE